MFSFFRKLARIKNTVFDRKFMLGKKIFPVTRISLIMSFFKLKEIIVFQFRTKLKTKKRKCLYLRNCNPGENEIENATFQIINYERTRKGTQTKNGTLSPVLFSFTPYFDFLSFFSVLQTLKTHFDQ